MKRAILLRGCSRAGKVALVGAILLFFGCQSLILDPRGHQVPEEKWIAVPEAGEQTGVFSNEDLTITYKLIRTSGQLRISGEIRFADRIANNFPIIEYFHLGAMLLNDQGKILDLANLASVAAYRTQRALIPDFPLLFNASLAFGGDKRYLAFNYTGKAIDGGDPEGGGIMDFWEFPAY